MSMKYKFRVSQTIYKQVEIEANDADEASDRIGEMIGDGDIHFDDEPFLQMECDYTLI